ncbi:MAG TPA: cupin domain-containing protein [Solirubrobacteraceae bacterium]|jgi:uncharacterized cupin superfamily protein
MPPQSWDDAPSETMDQGCLRRTRWDLGSHAGSVEVGLKRVQGLPGGQTSPVHAHGAEEEIFFVLSGSARLWQDGEVCEVRAGDCIVHGAEGPAHTLVAGPDGVDVLAFGERKVAEAVVLPRAGVAWVGDTWFERPGAGEHPFDREAALDPVDVTGVGERPANVVALADVDEQVTRRGRTDVRRRDLGRAAGSVTSGMKWIRVEPGARSYPHHWHSGEEELFVILGGDGVLRLGEEEHPVARGSLVARPAGTGVAHSFTAGAEGLEMLAYGQRRGNEMCFYPDSQKLSAAGIVFRVEQLDYWDGEE